MNINISKTMRARSIKFGFNMSHYSTLINNALENLSRPVSLSKN